VKHLKLVAVVGLLEVNNEFLLAIRNNKNADSTRALLEGLVNLNCEFTLGDNWDASLDLTRVGLDEEGSIITSLDDLVLLEAWGQDGVEDDRWRWVADNADFLAEFTGEQVNTEVSVLASGSGGGDANDLGWTLLEDDQVTNTDQVAGNSELSASRGWGSSWLSCWLWKWLGGLGLSDGHGFHISGNLITSVRLSIVALSSLALKVLNWVEDMIELLAEVLGVTVVVGAVNGRHLGRGFGGSFGLWLLGLLLFFLDNDDLWGTDTLFFGLAGGTGSLLNRKVYVDLFDVSGTRNVNLRTRGVTNKLLLGSGLAVVGGRLGFGFSLGFGFDFDLSDTNVLHVTVEIVRVMVDGVKLLLLGVRSDWDGSTSGKTCSGTSNESGGDVRVTGGVGGLSCVRMGGTLGSDLGSGVFSSSRRGFVRAGFR